MKWLNAHWLVLMPPVRGVLGSYSTCFEGRSESQQVNALWTDGLGCYGDS